jgi:hypothetical protein
MNNLAFSRTSIIYLKQKYRVSFRSKECVSARLAQSVERETFKK